MKKKIVISCASGLKNSGDEAILQAILENIDQAKFEVKVISFDPDYTKKHHGVDAIHHFDKKNKLWKKVISECDLFIMGGGGLLQDETTIYNVGFWLKKLAYAIQKGKLTYVFANSIGPINYKFNKIKIKKVLQKVTMITVRDERSFTYLKQLGIQKIILTSDPVFAIKVSQNDKLEKILMNYGINEKYVVISLRHWFDTIPLIPVKICVKFNLKTKYNQKKYENYCQSFAKYVRFLNEEYGYQVVFIPMCSGRDERIANEIISSQTSHMNISIQEELTPLEIIQLIEGSEFTLGMRLHALIYAIRIGKPFVALTYSSKVKGILELANLCQYGVDIENLSYQELKEKTELLLNNVDCVKENLKKIGKEFCDQALMNYELLVQVTESKEKDVE